MSMARRTAKRAVKKTVRKTVRRKRNKLLSGMLIALLLSGVGYVKAEISREFKSFQPKTSSIREIREDAELPSNASKVTQSGNKKNEQAPTNNPSGGNTNSLLLNWDESTAPNYYYVVGRAVVENEPSSPSVVTQSLDSLGRTQAVYAKINFKMVEDSAGWREQFDADDDPSGWGHNAEADITLPNGKNYHGYFWNRSHLVADSLGGHAERNNLVTGTRMQNVGCNQSDPGGMAYAETKARDWIWKHKDGTIYYSTIPNYSGSELIPRSVTVNIKTSDGSIDEQVIVYNYAKGYTIDYNKGTFQKQ